MPALLLVVKQLSRRGNYYPDGTRTSDSEVIVLVTTFREIITLDP